jgi:hypothetical protein
MVKDNTGLSIASLMGYLAEYLRFLQNSMT